MIMVVPHLLSNIIHLTFSFPIDEHLVGRYLY